MTRQNSRHARGPKFSKVVWWATSGSKSQRRGLTAGMQQQCGFEEACKNQAQMVSSEGSMTRAEIPMLAELAPIKPLL